MPTMSEVRTTSSTGGEKGVKPERYDLLPKAALDEIARVYAFGATKYADHNWLKGYEWSKSYAALQRHLTAWWAGEDTDPESGLSHLGHAGFHVFALLVFESRERFAQHDDRYKEPGRETLYMEPRSFTLHNVPPETLRLVFGLSEEDEPENAGGSWATLDSVRRHLEDLGPPAVSSDADRFVRNEFMVRRNPDYEFPNPQADLTPFLDLQRQYVEDLVAVSRVFVVGMDDVVDVADQVLPPSRWERG